GRGLYALAAPARLELYQKVLSIIPGELTDDLFHPDVLARGASDRILDCWQDLVPLMRHTDELGGPQFLEVRSSLPDELLLYADKLSMAHGLEVRVPYLDKEIVEYVERLSAKFKVRNGSGKWLHRRVARRLLPHNFLYRKKRGFAVNVVDNWFRDSMGNKMRDTLLDKESMIYQYLRPSEVQKLYWEHQSGEN